MIRESVDLRGTAGLLLESQLTEQTPKTRTLVWHERGQTYAIHSVGAAEEPQPSIVALAEQLEAVDPEVWRPYLKESEPALASTPTTAVPTHFLPEDQTHLTALGPGAVPAEVDPTEPTTTTTSGPPEPVDENVSTTAGPPPNPDLRPPTGSYVEDRIIVVDEGMVGSVAYSIGVHWSSWIGLCIGDIFEVRADEVGGYPIRCELDPFIGGGGMIADSVDGTVVYVFTPGTIDRATLEINGTEYGATLHQVSEFPEFTFAVFVLPEADVGAVDGPLLPGGVDLWLDGQSVGWG